MQNRDSANVGVRRVRALNASDGRGGWAGTPIDLRSGVPAPDAKVGNGDTAPTNRAVTLTEAGAGQDQIQLFDVESHIDWLAITFYCGLAEVLSGLAILLRLAPGDDPLLGFKEYQGKSLNFLRWFVGESITIHSDPDPDRPRKTKRAVRIEFKGQALERFALADLFEFIRYVESFCEVHPRWGTRFKCTRLDWAWDGHSITPAMIDAAMDQDNLRTNVNRAYDGWGRLQRSRKALSSFRIVDLMDLEPVKSNKHKAGSTVYLGHRTSTRMLRCYDCRGFNRLEVEFKDQRSDRILHELLESGDAAADRAASRMLEHLRAFVDFVDRSSSSNISRCELLPWWKEFVGQASRAVLQIPRVLTDAALAVKRVFKRAVNAFAEVILISKHTCVEVELQKIVERTVDCVLLRSPEKVNRQRLALKQLLEGEGDESFRNMNSLGLLDQLRLGGCPPRLANIPF